MKWILGIALAAASASLIVTALLSYSQSRSDGQLTLQEFASY